MRAWLRDIRKVKGLTQADVAKGAGICRSYYTVIENGKYIVPPKTAMKIAEVLGFDWTEFYKAG